MSLLLTLLKLKVTANPSPLPPLMSLLGNKAVAVTPGLLPAMSRPARLLMAGSDEVRYAPLGLTNATQVLPPRKLRPVGKASLIWNACERASGICTANWYRTISPMATFVPDVVAPELVMIDLLGTGFLML